VRALQIQEWGSKLREVTLSRRDLRVGEVRLRILACGVGRTVLNDMSGELTNEGIGSLPRVPGHEICGEVIEVGPNVTTVRVGQRGVVYFYITCGTCSFCRSGRESLCENLGGMVGVDIDGGYAEETVVPARNFVAISDELDPIGATTIPDAIATSLHICGPRARLGPGEVLAVVGAGGGVGVHLVQVGRLFGATVVGVDLSEEKLALAAEFGADVALPAWSTSEDITRVTGGDVDVIVDTVGSQRTLTWSLSVLGKGGRLVVLTTTRGRNVSETTARAVLDEISIIGSRYASYAEVDVAVRLVRHGRIRPVIGGHASLSDVEILHDRLRRQALLGRGVLVPGTLVVEDNRSPSCY
jgi:D-arabinose 1-dehydrogenase-like Zn-dependent alcohol dehydrogenase